MPTDAPRVSVGVLAGVLAVATVAALWAGYMLAAIVGAATIAGLRAAINHTHGETP